MERKDFLRNITLAFAAALLPKILQPSSFDIEELVDVPIQVNWVVFSEGGIKEKPSPEPYQFVLKMPKSEVDNFIKSNTQYTGFDI